VVLYVRPDLIPTSADRPAPVSAAPAVSGPEAPVETTGVSAQAAALPVARSVRVQISDAPPQLTATVDGRPAALPLVLPAGPTAHSVVFHAPGYGDRNIVVDGRVDRTLTLGMARLPAMESPTVGSERPASERPSRAATSGGAGASRRHRRAEPTAPPLELNDDERKL
jgi:hypothetical protein